MVTYKDEYSKAMSEIHALREYIRSLRYHLHAESTAAKNREDDLKRENMRLKSENARLRTERAELTVENTRLVDERYRASRNRGRTRSLSRGPSPPLRSASLSLVGPGQDGDFRNVGT